MPHRDMRTPSRTHSDVTQAPTISFAHPFLVLSSNSGARVHSAHGSRLTAATEAARRDGTGRQSVVCGGPPGPAGGARLPGGPVCGAGAEAGGGGASRACVRVVTTREAAETPFCCPGWAQVFDAGASFSVEQLQDGTRRVVCCAEAGVQPESAVFLVRSRRPSCWSLCALRTPCDSLGSSPCCRWTTRGRSPPLTRTRSWPASLAWWTEWQPWLV
jgi:hypothetical protein